MKMLCFGDSNTYGYDPRSYFGGRHGEKHRWVELLAEKLGYTAINAGENGREIPSTEGEWRRFDALLASQKPLDLLIIMLGTNDILQGNPPDMVTRRMKRFLERMDFEKSKILLLAPPPMQRGTWVPSQKLMEDSKALAQGYQALAQSLGIGYGDAGGWQIPLEFDGVHLTEEGHRALAEGLYNHLMKGGF